jgi:hypothetical protein
MKMELLGSRWQGVVFVGAQMFAERHRRFLRDSARLDQFRRLTRDDQLTDWRLDMFQGDVVLSGRMIGVRVRPRTPLLPGSCAHDLGFYCPSL